MNDWVHVTAGLPRQSDQVGGTQVAGVGLEIKVES